MKVLFLPEVENSFFELIEILHKEEYFGFKVLTKELERILKTCNINLSINKVIDISKTITTLKIKLPISGETLSKTMLITPRHKSIAKLFDENFWKNI